MKKIIELAERYLDTEELKAKIRTDYDEEEWHFQMSEIYNKLRSAIEDRKRLSETPITEEWLTEHGFTPNFTLYKNGTFLSITRECGKWYITETCIEVSSLADLYDALDLCGIKID